MCVNVQQSFETFFSGKWPFNWTDFAIAEFSSLIAQTILFKLLYCVNNREHK